MKNTHIKPLTSMRFIFCLMVFLSHITDILNDSEILIVKMVSSSIFTEGYLGVSFFFILSGFILSYTYQEKIITGKVSNKEFIINRITRIYPLHILTLLISIPLVFVNIEGILNGIIQFVNMFINIFLIQSFIPIKGIYFGFNSPSWSISNELFFYLLTPYLFRNFINEIKTNRFILILGLMVVVIIGIQTIPISYHHSIFYINPIVRLLDFIIGIYLYEIYKSNNIKGLNFTKSSLVEILSISLFIVFFYFHNDIPKVYRYSVYYWIPMLFIIYVFSVGKGLLSNMLSNRIFVYLGEISFGFYLIHLLVIKYFKILYYKLDLNMSELTQVSIIFIISLLLSIISFQYYENKVRGKLKGYLLGKLNN